MAKLIIVVLSSALIAVLAEPPSSYLPPQARNSPSSRYGAPSNGFGSSPSDRYGAPSAPSARSGARSGGSRSFSYNSLHENQFSGLRKSNGQGSRFNGQQSNGFGNGAHHAQPRNGNGFGNGRQAPSQQYGAPSQQYSAPRSFSAAPSAQYGAPSQQYGAPSSQYGAPAARTPSSEYGAPFGKSKMDDDLAEPANYEYNYEVRAEDESGAEFGHQESREEDSARGQYHVLLPDGRMQIVEYEADEEGFRPIIRYEETGAYPDARNGHDGQGPY